MDCMKKNMDSRECSGALIVCSRNGQAVQRAYMGNSKDVTIITQL